MADSTYKRPPVEHPVINPNRIITDPWNRYLLQFKDFVKATELDVSGDSGTGSINLSTQVLKIAGTANEVVTSASNQTITIGLPDSVTITSSLTIGPLSWSTSGDDAYFTTGTNSVIWNPSQSFIIKRSGVEYAEFGGSDERVKITATNGMSISSLTASTLVYSNASKVLTSLANASGFLLNNGSGSLSWASAVTGSGTANIIPIFTSASVLGDGPMSFDGATVTVSNNISLEGYVVFGAVGPQNYRLQNINQSLRLWNDTNGEPTSISIASLDQDGTDATAISIFGLGGYTDDTNTESASFYYDPAGPTFNLFTAKAGTGTVRDLVLYTGANTDQLRLTAAGGVSLSSLTASTLVYSGASKNLTSLSNASGYLLNDGSGAFSWTSTAIPSAHDILSTSHGDTTAASVVRGDIIIGSGATPKWTRLAKGTSGQALIMGADEPAWATISTGITIDSTPITSGTASRILFESATNKVSEDADLTFTTATNLLYVAGGVNIATGSTYKINSVNVIRVSGDSFFAGPGAGGNLAHTNATACGTGALGNAASNSTNSVAVGWYALGINAVTGESLIGIGAYALKDYTNGADSIGIGTNAGRNSNASRCFYAGTGAGRNNSGNDNFFLGYLVGYGAVGCTGTLNTFTGTYAGGGNTNAITSAAQNAAYGSYSLGRITTGFGNFCGGYFSGGAITSGSRNMLLGGSSGITISTTHDNTFAGFSSGYYSNGSRSLMLGAYCGEGTTAYTSNNVVWLGYQAGNNSTYLGTSNTLVIEASNSATPLISGTFAAHASGPNVRINGALKVVNIGDTLGRISFDVAGNYYISAGSSNPGMLLVSPLNTQLVIGDTTDTYGLLLSNSAGNVGKITLSTGYVIKAGAYYPGMTIEAASSFTVTSGAKCTITAATGFLFEGIGGGTQITSADNNVAYWLTVSNYVGNAGKIQFSSAAGEYAIYGGDYYPGFFVSSKTSLSLMTGATPTARLVVQADGSIDIGTNRIGYDGSAGGLIFDSSNNCSLTGNLSITDDKYIYLGASYDAYLKYDYVLNRLYIGATTLAATMNISADSGITLETGTGSIILNPYVDFILKTNGTTRISAADGGDVNIEAGAGADVTMFASASSGETRSLEISGFKSGDSIRTLSIGISSASNDSASFSGCGSYRFSGNIRAISGNYYVDDTYGYYAGPMEMYSDGTDGYIVTGTNSIIVNPEYKLYLKNNDVTHVEIGGGSGNRIHLIPTSGDSVIIGDATPTNYTEFDTTGHQTMTGTARPWRDELTDALNLKSTGVGVSVNSSENTVDFATNAQIASDYAYCNIQLNHDKDLSSVIKAHIHFFQAENNAPNWLVQYRWQKMGGAKVTSWTNLKCNSLASTYSSGTIHQVAYAASVSPPSGTALSDIVQFRICRDSDNDSGEFTGADPYTTTVGMMAFDVHFQINSIGSTDEYTK